jgi:hypothetical protein
MDLFIVLTICWALKATAGEVGTLELLLFPSCVQVSKKWRKKGTTLLQRKNKNKVHVVNFTGTVITDFENNIHYT